MKKTEAIYFPGFNGIRAIAAIIVLIWHVDQSMDLFGLSTTGFHANGMAGNAVNMFFVLSGFLITYLLLAEKDRTGTISIKSFYLRRVFRIWPIYYLSLIGALALVQFGVIVKPEDPAKSVLLYTLLLANLAYVVHLDITTITPLWSVGVEEQFYAIWPALLKKTKNILATLFVVSGAYLLLKLALWYLNPTGVGYTIVNVTRIDLMALGGMGAYAVFKDIQLVRKVIYSRIVQIVSWGALIYSCLVKPVHVLSFIDNEINALFYFVIILNVGTNAKTLVRLENAPLNFLGRISYGLYVYHMTVLVLASSLLKGAGFPPDSLLAKAAVYVIVIGSTVGIAALSFRYFEEPILRLKKKFGGVESSSVAPPTPEVALESDFGRPIGQHKEQLG